MITLQNRLMNAYYIAKSWVSLGNHLQRSKSKIVAVNKVQKYIDLGYLDSRTKSNPKLMMEMIAAYLQQNPVSSCDGRKHGKQRLGITSSFRP
jgi:hypothetical protein